MNLELLVSKLNLSGFTFVFPPKKKNLKSKMVRIGKQTVGVYQLIKSDQGYGLIFRFNDPRYVILLSSIGKSLQAKVEECGSGVLLYPGLLSHNRCMSK